MYYKPGDDSSLLRRYQTGHDLAARDELVRKYLPLVRSLAKRYSYTSEPLEDLCQVGAMALVKAIERYRPGNGASFKAYAVPTIVGELRRHQARGTWPAGGGAPGAVVTTLDEESLEAVVAESELRRSETRVVLRGAFRGLTRRERQVVALRFYRDLTQQRIAEELGLSQAQVSRILSSALTKLRRALGEP